MRYFVAVAECRSITKAAQQLYISQPSLSRSIAAAEEEAGVLLLDRTSRPLSLTYAGQRCYETARQILALSTDLTLQFHDIGECRSGRIMLGASSQRFAYTLPAVLPRFLEKYPGVEITTCEEDSAHLEQALLRGQVDLIIFPDQTELQANDLIDTVVLGPEEFVLVCGEGGLGPEFCLDGDPHTVDFAKLAEQPFVLLKQGHGSRRMCDKVFRQYGFSPRVAFECDSNGLALRMAAANVGLAMVPRNTVNMYAGSVTVQAFSLSDPPLEWNVLASFRRGRYQTRAEQYLLSLLLEYYHAHP